MKRASDDDGKNKNKDDDEAQGLDLLGTCVGGTTRFISTRGHASIVALPEPAGWPER